MEHCKCAEGCMVSRKNLRYPCGVFPATLKIQRCGNTSQSSNHAPVSIGEQKTEIAIYIPFFSKAGELCV